MRIAARGERVRAPKRELGSAHRRFRARVSRRSVFTLARSPSYATGLPMTVPPLPPDSERSGYRGHQLVSTRTDRHDCSLRTEVGTCPARWYAAKCARSSGVGF